MPWALGHCTPSGHLCHLPPSPLHLRAGVPPSDHGGGTQPRTLLTYPGGGCSRQELSSTRTKGGILLKGPGDCCHSLSSLGVCRVTSLPLLKHEKHRRG